MLDGESVLLHTDYCTFNGFTDRFRATRGVETGEIMLKATAFFVELVTSSLEMFDRSEADYCLLGSLFAALSVSKNWSMVCFELILVDCDERFAISIFTWFHSDVLCWALRARSWYERDGNYGDPASTRCSRFALLCVITVRIPFDAALCNVDEGRTWIAKAKRSCEMLPNYELRIVGIIGSSLWTLSKFRVVRFLNQLRDFKHLWDNFIHERSDRRIHSIITRKSLSLRRSTNCTYKVYSKLFVKELRILIIYWTEVDQTWFSPFALGALGSSVG